MRAGYDFLLKVKYPNVWNKIKVMLNETLSFQQQQHVFSILLSVLCTTKKCAFFKLSEIFIMVYNHDINASNRGCCSRRIQKNK